MYEAIKKDLAQLLDMKESLLLEDFRVIDHDLWDSLSMVSMMSSIAKHHQVSIASESLELCETVGDIYRLIPQTASYL